MSSTGLVGVYQPGDSLLHRAPVGPKLAGLAAFSLAIVLVRSMPASWVFLAVALLLGLAARVRLVVLARAARTVLLLAAFVGAMQWWWYGRDKAIETFVDLVALSVAAVVVTATTPVNAMLDALIRWIPRCAGSAWTPRRSRSPSGSPSRPSPAPSPSPSRRATRPAPAAYATRGRSSRRS